MAPGPLGIPGAHGLKPKALTRKAGLTRFDLEFDDFFLTYRIMVLFQLGWKMNDPLHTDSS